MKAGRGWASWRGLQSPHSLPGDLGATVATSGHRAAVFLLARLSSHMGVLGLQRGCGVAHMKCLGNVEPHKGEVSFPVQFTKCVQPSLGALRNWLLQKCPRLPCPVLTSWALPHSQFLALPGDMARLAAPTQPWESMRGPAALLVAGAPMSTRNCVILLLALAVAPGAVL